MRCPNPECDSYSHRVKDTDGRLEDLTMRLCQCQKCGMVFSTAEYYIDAENARRLHMDYIKPGILDLNKARRELD